MTNRCAIAMCANSPAQTREFATPALPQRFSRSSHPVCVVDSDATNLDRSAPRACFCGNIRQLIRSEKPGWQHDVGALIGARGIRPILRITSEVKLLIAALGLGSLISVEGALGSGRSISALASRQCARQWIGARASLVLPQEATRGCDGKENSRDSNSD